MEALAAEFAGRAHFPFIYVREAHPGELIPPIQSMEEKAAQRSPSASTAWRAKSCSTRSMAGCTAATGASRT